MLMDAYKRAWEILKTKPIKLWGYSLLAMFILFMAEILFWSIPAAILAVELFVICATSLMFINALTGGEITSEEFFAVIKKENVLRVLGGMAWYTLWTTLWMFVPVYGIYKIYTYRFVPYILVKMPEVGALEALEKSKEKTEGKVLNMFLCDLCFIAAIVVIYVLFTILAVVTALIPIVGWLLSIVIFIVEIALCLAIWLVGPVFVGLYQAYFFESELEVAAFEVEE